MTALVNLLRELAGLFVDDGALALAIIAVVVAATIVSTLSPGSILAGAVLLFGCVGVLLANVLKAARN